MAPQKREGDGDNGEVEEGAAAAGDDGDDGEVGVSFSSFTSADVIVLQYSSAG